MSIIFGDGKQTRDFVYVKDVAKANLLALERGDNEVVNIINTNRPTNINELVEMMNKIMNTSLEPIYTEPRKRDIMHSYLDNKKHWKYLERHRSIV